MKNDYAKNYDITDIDFIEWNRFRNKTFLITGATGLIGKAIIKLLTVANQNYDLGINIIALVRDLDKAKSRFENIEGQISISFIIGTVENITGIAQEVDYVVHGASQTASKEFVQCSVETLETAIIGTNNMLRIAKEKKVKSFVYLSSMEMYGYPERGHLVTEDEAGAFSPLNLRNSYPIAKQACEAMCCAYANEYGVSAKIVRLTQTVGDEYNYNDNRIFAYLKKCVDNNEDIVLKTKGETERCYVYEYDAASAILAVLLDGKNGNAYNVADENSYCSIAEMAKKVADEAGVKLIFDVQDESDNGYPQTLYMHLETSKLRDLGWKPIHSF